MYSRRDFVKLSLATIPLAAYGKQQSVIDGVHLGCITYNWRDLPDIPGAVNQVDAWIQVLKELGVAEIELMNLVIQPTELNAPPGGGAAGGRGALPAEQQEARLQARDKLREWRLTTPMSEFVLVKQEFNNEGITIDSYGCNMADDYTDAEIERLFLQARALGVRCIATSTQMSMAKRLVPFAGKHKLIVAFHNLSNVNDTNQIASVESCQAIYDLSEYFMTNIDLGHMTAANIDALDYVRRYHARISFLHFNDRKRNQGPAMPYGQGDTPLKEVLQLLKKNKYPLPCIIEVDYPIPEESTTMAEWRRCLGYLQRALT